MLTYIFCNKYNQLFQQIFSAYSRLEECGSTFAVGDGRLSVRRTLISY